MLVRDRFTLSENEEAQVVRNHQLPGAHNKCFDKLDLLDGRYWLFP